MARKIGVIRLSTWVLVSGFTSACDYGSGLDDFAVVEPAAEGGTEGSAAEASVDMVLEVPAQDPVVLNPCATDKACMSQHRQCVSAGTVANCGDCLAGFSESLGRCIPGPVCEGTKTCSDHGTCDDSSGSAQCTCWKGYAGTACDQCAEDYVAWPADSNTCVDNPCIPDPCTAQGATPKTCAQEGETTYSCKCDEGYGWAEGACIPSCTDADGDGYGSGLACLGPDCTDSDPEVWENGQFTIKNVDLGSDGSTLKLHVGESVSGKLDYVVVQSNNCFDCLHEVVVGISGDGYGGESFGCVPAFIPQVCPGYESGSLQFKVRAPDNPGTYSLSASNFLQYSCVDAESYFNAGNAQVKIGQISVSANQCAPGMAYVMYPSLNGGPANFTGEGGETVNLTASYYVADPGGTSRLQIVIGLNTIPQGCLYDGKPPKCDQPGHPGAGELNLSVSAKPGLYYVMTKVTTAPDCAAAMAQYAAAPPARTATIARILVK